MTWNSCKTLIETNLIRELQCTVNANKQNIQILLVPKVLSTKKRRIDIEIITSSIL